MADNSDRPIRVLSFDGGGVRGLSSILILEYIMRSINARREADKRDPVEPWEYFDLIGGASTGGIIAIMLGRLRMPISECVEAYKELSRAIFTPNHPPESPIEEVEYLNGEGKFDSEAFEKAIKTQIQNSKVANDNDQILLQDTKSPCKVCVLALRENTSDPVIFRSYDYAGAGLTLFNKCKVWEACRATSASPTFFDPVQIEGRRFIDGGLGYNNPIFKVYDEARKIWKDRTIIATSIGTGEAPGTKFNGTRKQIAESIKKIITDCDRIADDFYNLKEDMVKEGRYFRLSVTHGLSNIGLEEHDHIGTITDHTEVYLSKGEPQAKLNLCTEALLQEHDLLSSGPTCQRPIEYEGMNFRLNQIVVAHDDTCGWLLENKNYTSWVQNDNGLLWIRGSPGSGKSTLMKYIYTKINMPTVNAPDLKLSFFFHARGKVELLKSPLGMFLSLLLQLYNRDSEARAKIEKKFNLRSKEDIVAKLKLESTEETDKKIFNEIICHISRSKKVTIFIDALDETGEEDANSLANYFVKLHDEVHHIKGTVKICFSSRHYPIMALGDTKYQEVTVERENRAGIRSFINNEFKENLQGRGQTESEESENKLKENIIAKANGLFQWVCLVLPIIFKAYREEEHRDSIQNIVNHLPEGLEKTYRYILKSLIGQKKQNREEQKKHRMRVLKLFRLVCFAARPLSVEEMRHAMAVTDKPLLSRAYNLDSSDEYVKRKMEIRITALSGGLVEVRENYIGTVVQVNHQTVREFLLEEGFEILTGWRTSSDPEEKMLEKKRFKGSCHDILARLCINYLWTEEVQKLSMTMDIDKPSTWTQSPTSETLPLLPYAIAAFFWHASMAEKNGYSQDRLLKQFKYRYTRKLLGSDILEQGLFSLWCSAGRIFCLRDYFGVLPSEGSTLLHIASMANIPTAVQILLREGAKVYEKDEFGQQAIHYAARGGATDVAEILIEAPRLPKFLYSVVDAEDNNSVTPLQLAARNKKVNVMRLLIAEDATPKCLLEENSTKLKKIRGDTAKTVSLLLEDAAEFNAQSLHNAAVFGDLRAVRLLLAEGADVNARRGHYSYALVAAAIEGRTGVVKVLLQNGAEIDAQSETYGSALVAAALQGNMQMIGVLLQAGADVNADHVKYGSALAVASQNGHKALMEILINQGAEINAPSGEFGNALTAAAYHGHTEIVDMLLKQGADINAQSGVYGNALIAAVLNRKEEVIMLLLEKGAETNVLIGDYTNALALAAGDGDISVVEALLKAKADYNLFLSALVNFKQDTRLRSLAIVLLIAAWIGRLDIVESAIARSHRIDRSRNAPRDTNFRTLSSARLNAAHGTKMAQYNSYTVLQLSAAAGHPKVVAKLLAAGADVNAAATTYGGRTALQAAAKCGHLEIVKTLLDAGANVDSVNSHYDQTTALHVAAMSSHREIVRVLLDHGANPNLKASSYENCMALQIAAKIGDLEMVTMLLEAGAHVNASAGLGITPLYEARRAGHLDVAAMLSSAGGKLYPQRYIGND